jgi:pyridoxamine 5'-phosphate oxidase
MADASPLRPDQLPEAGTHRSADLRAVRDDYALAGLSEDEAGEDPFALLRRWTDDAIAADLFDPTAMVVSTVGADGRPSARMVLCKGFDETGLVFFTNYESHKGRELAAHPACSLLFPWHPLQRQVRVEGEASYVEARESEEYFASRPRPSQLGAVASPQSERVESREVLDQRLADLEQEYDGRDVPRPAHWGGYRVAPHRFEFWQGRKGRLHDRVVFERRSDGSWERYRLAP